MIGYRIGEEFYMRVVGGVKGMMEENFVYMILGLELLVSYDFYQIFREFRFFKGMGWVGEFQ